MRDRVVCATRSSIVFFDNLVEFQSVGVAKLMSKMCSCFDENGNIFLFRRGMCNHPKGSGHQDNVLLVIRCVSVQL